MHDLDRTQNQFETDPEGFETDQFEFHDEVWNETDPEAMDEADEIQLAAELLEVADEEELDQFLGKMFKGIGRGLGKLARGPLGNILKGIARKALPVLGGVAGTFFGGPAGTAIGSQLAGGAGKLFGLEVEGLSGEDQEFAVARRYVRLAGAAIRNAARASGGDPRAVARAALAAAARRYAPGLLVGVPVPSAGGCSCNQPAAGGGGEPADEFADEMAGGGAAGGMAAAGGAAGGGMTGGGRRSGRWVRRGNRIIILGV